MTTDLLPLRERPFHARIVHLDDAGRCLDRSRIMISAAIEELLAAAHMVNEAEGLAEELAALKIKVIAAWNGLDEPELPLN